MRHRPIGIGVQGLAHAFILLRLPFDSNEGRLLNKKKMKRWRRVQKLQEKTVHIQRIT